MITTESDPRVQPGFRLSLIANKPRVETWSGASKYIDLEVKLNQFLTINKRIFFRTQDEGDWKKDTWKIARLMDNAGVDPVEVKEDEEGKKHKTYDESELYGKELIALIYTNPESGYMDVFDFLAPNASDAEKSKLFTRFDKWYTDKYGAENAIKEEEPPRERTEIEPQKETAPVTESEGTDETAKF